MNQEALNIYLEAILNHIADLSKKAFDAGFASHSIAWLYMVRCLLNPKDFDDVIEAILIMMRQKSKMEGAKNESA